MPRRRAEHAPVGDTAQVGDTTAAAATAPARPVDPSEPAWTAAAVARRLGVAPSTLRSWSRRHGIGPPGHTPGRHRRWTTTDLAEIDAVRALVAQSVALPAAAATVHSHRRAGASGPPDDVGPDRSDYRTDGVAALVGAAQRLDSAAATAVLTRTLDEHGVIAGWERLCRPAFAALDDPAARGRGCTDAQLLLSWVVTTCLRRLAAGAPPSPGRAVLLACAAQDHHALPLEALCAALAEQHLPAVMLGPAVPVIALRHAVHRLRPAAFVVSAHRTDTGRSAVLADLLEHAGTVIAAGPGWHRPTIPAAVQRANTLQVAIALTVAAAAG